MDKTAWIIIFCLLWIFTACNNDTTPNLKIESDIIPSFTSTYFPKDTLNAVTQYGATSYFYYRDEKMGYDYELAISLAKFYDLVLDVTVAKNDREMAEILRSGKADIAIFNTAKTKKLSKDFNYVFPQEETYPVLVQLINRDAISDLTELAGKEVWVVDGSLLHERLKALNDEIGGGIDIKLADDSLTVDGLMLQVSNKEIPFTVAYRRNALLQKIFFYHLDIRIPIGVTQQNGWLVRKSNTALTDSIDKWLQNESTKRIKRRLHPIYWAKNPYFAFKKVHVPEGAISPYDDLFKEAAKRISWDWKLLAAVAYVESGFDSTAISWAGAQGVMQLMPSTALIYGVDTFDIIRPVKSIFAGTEYIKSLDMIYRKIEDEEERKKFILASYNAGPAHIIDAMALTEKYGKDKYIWFDNVEYYLEKLSDPEFYNDSVVKYGPFRGNETLRYVPYVLDTYERYLTRK
ncbi:MAG: transglycosylase SLT domain-containing protein [Bacteroidales bacterium]|nr:transglycosylase SLT domain-containing protein [Bacteroidales bacterium]